MSIKEYSFSRSVFIDFLTRYGACGKRAVGSGLGDVQDQTGKGAQGSRVF